MKPLVEQPAHMIDLWATPPTCTTASLLPRLDKPTIMLRRSACALASRLHRQPISTTSIVRPFVEQLTLPHFYLATPARTAAGFFQAASLLRPLESYAHPSLAHPPLAPNNRPSRALSSHN